MRIDAAVRLPPSGCLWQFACGHLRFASVPRCSGCDCRRSFFGNPPPREAGLARRLLQFRLEDPEPLLFHDEPILRDGEIVSTLTSGNYGHHLGAAIGLGYVPSAGERAEQVLASSYEIEIAGRRHGARASLRPLYDPAAARVRA